VVLGIVPGALCGARFMAILPVKPLRLLFSIVILLLALQMIYHGLEG